MTLEHPFRALLARAPDGDAAILARARHAAVLEESDRVDRALVEAQHLERRVALERPADGGGIEAAGHGRLAVRRDRARAPRPAVTAQLRVGGSNGERQQRQ